MGYLQAQVRRFLSFEGDNAARMVNNLDWTAPLSAIDFLREIGKHYRVGTMLRKDAVASRLSSDEGISYTEFSYQILQGIDYLQLFRDHGCVLQTGGWDQWGNLTSGVELIHKVEGKHVHALGTPLITNCDGTKFGKSEGNAIWLDPAMCSPYAFYQFWLNTDDADVADRLKVFTFLTRAEIEALELSVAERPFAREGQRKLAYEVTSLVHGVDATDKVIAASAAVFGNGDLSVLDEATLKAATSELPSATVDAGALGIIELLVASGLSESSPPHAVPSGKAGPTSTTRRCPTPTPSLRPPSCCTGATCSCAGARRIWQRWKSPLPDAFPKRHLHAPSRPICAAGEGRVLFSESPPVSGDNPQQMRSNSSCARRNNENCFNSAGRIRSTK